MAIASTKVCCFLTADWWQRRSDNRKEKRGRDRELDAGERFELSRRSKSRATSQHGKDGAPALDARASSGNNGGGHATARRLLLVVVFCRALLWTERQVSNSKRFAFTVPASGGGTRGLSQGGNLAERGPLATVWAPLANTQKNLRNDGESGYG